MLRGGSGRADPRTKDIFRPNDIFVVYVHVGRGGLGCQIKRGPRKQLMVYRTLNLAFTISAHPFEPPRSSENQRRSDLGPKYLAAGL